MIKEMALTPLLSQTKKHHLPLSITCNLKPNFHSPKPTRRRTVISSSSSILTLIFLSREATFSNNFSAKAFDFRMTVPDQTLEEAEAGIRGHAQALLQVKELINLESWKEAQKTLRKNTAFFKQDIYTIIQNKPGNKRPYLRKMYSTLFNNVTRLDYAARDKDEKLVWQCYENILVALDDILSRI